MNLPIKQTPAKPRSLVGELMGQADKEFDLLSHRATVKKLKRLWSRPARGACREALASFREYEISLGKPFPRDHPSVRKAILAAWDAQDWRGLKAIATWCGEKFVAARPDPLSVFLERHWVTSDLARDGWTGLRDLDDFGISLLAKRQGIRFNAPRGLVRQGDGTIAVRTRRLALVLTRQHDPRYTYRQTGSRLEIKRLAA